MGSRTTDGSPIYLTACPETNEVSESESVQRRGGGIGGRTTVLISLLATITTSTYISSPIEPRVDAFNIDTSERILLIDSMCFLVSASILSRQPLLRCAWYLSSCSVRDQIPISRARKLDRALLRSSLPLGIGHESTKRMEGDAYFPLQRSSMAWSKASIMGS